MAQAAEKKRQQNNFADELGDLRDYGDSDPPARIDWKRYAATRETMVRDHGADTQGEMILRQPRGDLETGAVLFIGRLGGGGAHWRTGAHDLERRRIIRFMTKRRGRRLFMLWRGQNRLAFLPGTAKAQLTALLLALASAPVALMMAYFTDMRAFMRFGC